MEIILQFVAFVAVVGGTAFAVIGVLGLIRLPDVYSRLHATGKVGVFGVVLLLIAVIARTQAGLGRGLVLIALLLIGGPVVSHALGSAAYRLRVPMKRAVCDDLAQAQGECADAELVGVGEERWTR